MKRLMLAAAGVLLAANAYAADPFTLSSSSFKSGTLLPKKTAGNIQTNPNCVGENVSPQLSWPNPPAGTASYAITMTDPEGRAGQGVDHWHAYGIPASVTSFAEGATSNPSDKFVIFATDLDPKALPPGLSRTELIEKLNGHVKASSSITGLFKNPY
jgi:hypothetical protein